VERAKLNWPLAIACLLLSCMLWALNYPQAVTEGRRELNAEVFTEGLPAGMTITSMPNTIAVTAQGSSERLDQIDPSQLRAVVQLSNATPGRKAYRVTFYPPHYKEFFAWRPVTVPITIEALSSRTMPVEVETYGQMKDPAIALDETLVNPQTVTVTGPKSVVEELARARAVFDLTNVDLTNKEDQPPVGVEVLLPNGTVPQNVKLEVRPMLVRVTPVLTAAPQQKTVFVNPILEGSPFEGYISAGYQITPNNITLRGPSRAMASVTQIATEPINLAGVKQTTDFIVNLVVPRGLTADRRRVTVRVLIKPVQPVGSSETGAAGTQ
jgi:YbbR domain-containing protein